MIPDTAPLVFVAHAKEDADWAGLLREQLRSLERQGRVSVWPGEAAIGDVCDARLQGALEAAEVAVLVLSPAFLSDAELCTRVLPRLIERSVPLLPLPARRCVPAGLSLGAGELDLKRLEPATPWERPLQALEDHEQADVLVRLVERLLGVLDGAPAPDSAPPRPARAAQRVLDRVEGAELARPWSGSDPVRQAPRDAERAGRPGTPGGEVPRPARGGRVPPAAPGVIAVRAFVRAEWGDKRPLDLHPCLSELEGAERVVPVELLETVKSRLKADRNLAIVGPGGSGKSVLAVALALDYTRLGQDAHYLNVYGLNVDDLNVDDLTRIVPTSRDSLLVVDDLHLAADSPALAKRLASVVASHDLVLIVMRDPGDAVTHFPQLLRDLYERAYWHDPAPTDFDAVRRLAQRRGKKLEETQPAGFGNNLTAFAYALGGGDPGNRALRDAGGPVEENLQVAGAVAVLGHVEARIPLAVVGAPADLHQLGAWVGNRVLVQERDSLCFGDGPFVGLLLDGMDNHWGELRDVRAHGWRLVLERAPEALTTIPNSAASDPSLLKTTEALRRVLAESASVAAVLARASVAVHSRVATLGVLLGLDKTWCDTLFDYVARLLDEQGGWARLAGSMDGVATLAKRSGRYVGRFVEALRVSDDVRRSLLDGLASGGASRALLAVDTLGAKDEGFRATLLAGLAQRTASLLETFDPPGLVALATALHRAGHSTKADAIRAAALESPRRAAEYVADSLERLPGFLALLTKSEANAVATLLASDDELPDLLMRQPAGVALALLRRLETERKRALLGALVRRPGSGEWLARTDSAAKDVMDLLMFVRSDLGVETEAKIRNDSERAASERARASFVTILSESGARRPNLWAVLPRLWTQGEVDGGKTSRAVLPAFIGDERLLRRALDRGPSLLCNLLGLAKKAGVPLDDSWRLLLSKSLRPGLVDALAQDPSRIPSLFDLAGQMREADLAPVFNASSASPGFWDRVARLTPDLMAKVLTRVAPDVSVAMRRLMTEYGDLVLPRLQDDLTKTVSLLLDLSNGTDGSAATALLRNVMDDMLTVAAPNGRIADGMVDRLVKGIPAIAGFLDECAPAGHEDAARSVSAAVQGLVGHSRLAAHPLEELARMALRVGMLETAGARDAAVSFMDSVLVMRSSDVAHALSTHLCASSTLVSAIADMVPDALARLPGDDVVAMQVDADVEGGQIVLRSIDRADRARVERVTALLFKVGAGETLARRVGDAGDASFRYFGSLLRLYGDARRRASLAHMAIERRCNRAREAPLRVEEAEGLALLLEQVPFELPLEGLWRLVYSAAARCRVKPAPLAVLALHLRARGIHWIPYQSILAGVAWDHDQRNPVQDRLLAAGAMAAIGGRRKWPPPPKDVPLARILGATPYGSRLTLLALACRHWPGVLEVADRKSVDWSSWNSAVARWADVSAGGLTHLLLDVRSWLDRQRDGTCDR